MRKIYFALIALHILLRAPLAQAEIYIWDAQRGLIPAANCKSIWNDDKVVQPALVLKSLPPAFPMETRWERQNKTGQNLSLVCGDKSTIFDLYDVFSAEASSPIAEVAIDPSLVALSSLVSVDKAEPVNEKSEVPVIEGALAYAVCTSGQKLNVYDKSLSQVLFQAEDSETLRPVQSFTSNASASNGFVLVQFPARKVGANTGWIAKSELKANSQCTSGAQAKSLATTSAPAPTADTWTFPTNKRPTDSYKTGQRRFSAARSGGRLHAACDLYRNVNEEAAAISSGQVIRDRYYFYQGTYALEVKHPGGKIARYGEITGKAAPGVKLNATVKPGQTVGYVGKVNSNCCNPMLHFEFYSGTRTGALTQSGNAFQRRSDLINPTDFLTQWEKLKFGQSY